MQETWYWHCSMTPIIILENRAIECNMCRGGIPWPWHMKVMVFFGRSYAINLAHKTDSIKIWFPKQKSRHHYTSIHLPSWSKPCPRSFSVASRFFHRCHAVYLIYFILTTNANIRPDDADICPTEVA